MNNVSLWLLEKLLGEDGHDYAITREYSAGDCIFSAGDRGDYLAVLLSGRVEIRKGELLLSIVDHGSMFGEMGIIDRRPRIADAYAKSQCRIAEIREGQFNGLLRGTPEFGLAIMRLLTDRIRNQKES